MSDRHQRIMLTAKQVRSCPFFKVGDRMVLKLPQVLADESDGICVYMVNKLVSQLSGAFSDKSCLGFQLAGDITQMDCPQAEGGVTFEVARVQESEIFARLKEVPLFASLPDTVVRTIEQLTTVEDYQAGETIIRRGDPGEKLFVVLEGVVDVLREGKDGTESLIVQLGKHDWFGEMSLFTGEPYSATVRAAWPLRLITLRRTDFERLLDENPVLTRSLFTLLAQRLRRTNALMEEAIERGIIGRLSTISLPELVQAISLGRRTGILHLNYKSSKARVYFESGSITDCVLDDAYGEEAFYGALRWPDGDFRFEQKPIAGARRITIDTMSLLMEGMRRLDEGA